MRVQGIVAFLVIGLVCLSGSVRAGSFVVREHVDDTSYTMPSIAPAENPNEFNVTFVEATNYHMSHFVGSGNIYAGKILVDKAAGQADWIENPIRLNGSTPAMIGPPNDGDLGDSRFRNLIARPSRRGDIIAWSEFYNPFIHYYDFSETRHDIIPKTTEWGRALNPAVSENGAIAYWTRGPEPLWTLRVWDNGGELFSITDPVYIPPDLFSLSMTRRADIVGLESGETRVAYSRCMDEHMLELWWTNDTTEGTPIGGYLSQPDFIISSIQMSEDFLIWQERFSDAPPDSEGEIHAAVWDGQGYEYIGPAGMSAASRDPSLFGSYLVYVTPDCQQLEMVDLHNLNSEGVEPTVLLSAEPDHTLNWPAVWVDENTGEYLVLYESMGSPADILGQTGTTVPEPGTFVLLALGGLTVLGAAWLRRRRGA